MTGDPAEERALLTRIVRVVAAQLEDEALPDMDALERFADFVGGLRFYLTEVVGITGTPIGGSQEVAA